jgi:hypothetical protein
VGFPSLVPLCDPNAHVTSLDPKLAVSDRESSSHMVVRSPAVSAAIILVLSTAIDAGENVCF